MAFRRTAETPDTPQAPKDVRPGLALVGTATVLAAVLSSFVSSLSTLVVAVIVGAFIGNVGLATDRTQPGLTFAAKRLLRVGVVLLGLRLSLTDVVDLGSRGLAVVAVTVVATFFGTQAIGRRLGLSRDLSLLVATGYSICGASAIAAVEGSTDADEEEVAAAIGLVTLFGSLAIVALPALANIGGLSDDQFGAWAGASVHDVAQVAATASTGGAAVVATAMVVKLTRVVLLTPIVIGVNLHRRGRSDGPDDARGGISRHNAPPVLPLFVAGFVAMVMLRTTGWLPDVAIDSARTFEGLLLAAALVGLGAGVRVDRLRKLGPKPLILGMAAWVLVASVSYLGIIFVV
ncbi:UNVERIFIED_CONTAM: hypothetical protein GTU68_061543 [Idotea baltica]|nr:hypothetical protein [Idotea baltica]